MGEQRREETQAGPTETQLRWLAVIASFQNPPTWAELGMRMGVASKNSVHEMLDKLEAHGFIVRPRQSPRGTPREARNHGEHGPSRSLRLTDAGRAALGLPTETLEQRVTRLESQVRSIQVAMPKGIDHG